MKIVCKNQILTIKGRYENIYFSNNQWLGKFNCQVVYFYTLIRLINLNKKIYGKPKDTKLFLRIYIQKNFKDC